MPKLRKQVLPIDRAGWPKRDWCYSAGIGVSTHDELPDALKPAFVRLGRRRLIIEAPRDWLARVGKAA